MDRDMYMSPKRNPVLGMASEMATKPPPTSNNEVSEQLGELGASLEKLHNYLFQLESRLDPVLRPIPVGGAESAQSGQTMCPIANEIYGHRGGVDSAATRILHILDRLGI